jgi:hypothetical protein
VEPHWLSFLFSFFFPMIHALSLTTGGFCT